MSKIKKIASRSSIMDISIKYGKDVVKFNLFEELVVDENKLNDELKNQPSYYGFLAMLMAKLKRVMEDKKAELNKIEKELFLEYKEDKDPHTGRPYSNDMAEASIVSEPDYIKALDNYNKAEEDYNIVKACVDAFTQRSHLIQTISANMRKITE